MPKIAIILPNAVTIRDVVHTGTLGEILSIPDLRLQIYTQNPDLPEFEELRASDQVELFPLPEHRPNFIERYLRHIYPLLYFDDLRYLQINLHGRPLRTAVATAIAKLRKLIGKQRTARWFGILLSRVMSRGAGDVLRGKPDLVIGTRSLVASLEFPHICEAARRGLPLLMIASSWDNFTTKGYLPLPVERTIVWNRKMADELVELFDVERATVVEAGYPRLPLLRDTGPFENAEAYLTELGLPQYQRFILYSASYGELTRDDPDKAPREFQLLKHVASQLQKDLPGDTCIIARLHPYSRADDEEYLKGIEKVHTFLPGRHDRYVERVMNSLDENHLAAQLQFSECIISMASTMTIDSLALGRPILNVAFEPDDAHDSITRFYGYDHFADLLRVVRPPLARDIEDVRDFVNRCLNGDQALGIDVDAFEAFYVPSSSATYPLTVRQTVEDILQIDRRLGTPYASR